MFSKGQVMQFRLMVKSDVPFITEKNIFLFILFVVCCA